jgi:hypothetical protein
VQIRCKKEEEEYYTDPTTSGLIRRNIHDSWAPAPKQNVQGLQPYLPCIVMFVAKSPGLACTIAKLLAVLDFTNPQDDHPQQVD